MAVDISQETQAIRTAVFAKDVRDNIAGGLDTMASEINTYENNLSSDNDQFKTDIGNRQTNLENTFNQEIANQSVANPSNAETVAARTDNVANTTYSTLGARLDAHSSQLADNANKVKGVTTLDEYINYAIKDSNGNITDWAPAFQKAINDGYTNFELTSGWYVIRQPITFKYNSGPRIISRSALKQTVLNVFIPSGYEDRAVFEYKHDSTVNPNYSGIEIKGIHLIGNDSVCHGIFLQDVSYFDLDCIIEGFKGAGLLLDKCQDSSGKLVIQNCGRTSGDYSSLADRSDNSKTLYSPLHLISTVLNDHNNMIRFNDCQIEQNKVSPYVWIHDAGAIGITFKSPHIETRDSSDFNNFDFLLADGADIEFLDCNVSSSMRNGVIINGAGIYNFTGGRNIKSIIGNHSGINIILMATNIQADIVTLLAQGGSHKFTNCFIDTLNISYPATGMKNFIGVEINNLNVDHYGADPSRLNFIYCQITNITSDINAKNIQYFRCFIKGTINSLSVKTSFIKCDLSLATISNMDKINNSSIIFDNNILYTDTLPIYGTWVKGAKVINTSATNTGDVYMYLCVQNVSLNGSFDVTAFKPIIKIQ